MFLNIHGNPSTQGRIWGQEGPQELPRHPHGVFPSRRTLPGPAAGLEAAKVKHLGWRLWNHFTEIWGCFFSPSSLLHPQWRKNVKGPPQQWRRERGLGLPVTSDHIGGLIHRGIKQKRDYGLSQVLQFGSFTVQLSEELLVILYPEEKTNSMSAHFLGFFFFLKCSGLS